MPSGPPAASPTGAWARTVTKSKAAETRRAAAAEDRKRGRVRNTTRSHDRSGGIRLCDAKLDFTMQSAWKARPRAPPQVTAAGLPRSARFEVAQDPGANVFALGRRVRIEQHLLEHRKVAKKALASVGRDAAERLAAGVLRALRDLDEPRGLEDFQVTGEIPIRQPAKLFDHRKRQALRMREQRREHTQARALVHHPIETFVRERRRPLALGFSSLHSSADIRTAAPRRP